VANTDSSWPNTQKQYKGHYSWPNTQTIQSFFSVDFLTLVASLFLGVIFFPTISSGIDGPATANGTSSKSSLLWKKNQGITIEFS
jgi:hypothetical protein